MTDLGLILEVFCEIEFLKVQLDLDKTNNI